MVVRVSVVPPPQPCIRRVIHQSTENVDLLSVSQVDFSQGFYTRVAAGMERRCAPRFVTDVHIDALRVWRSLCDHGLIAQTHRRCRGRESTDARFFLRSPVVSLTMSTSRLPARGSRTTGRPHALTSVATPQNNAHCEHLSSSVQCTGARHTIRITTTAGDRRHTTPLGVDNTHINHITKSSRIHCGSHKQRSRHDPPRAEEHARPGASMLGWGMDFNALS